MENKQTAVEWLKDQLEYFGNKHELTVSWTTVDELVELAKAMEKEQIKESWNDGNLLGRNGHILLEYNTGEQYFNETYGK